MKAIHKRAEKWDGFAFTTLEEAADFIAELEPLLKGAGTEVETRASVSTEDRDFRELTLEELRELSAALAVDNVQTIFVNCCPNNEQPVQATLLLHGSDGSRPSTQLDVKGHDQVAVDGVNVWGKKELQTRFERIDQAKTLAVAKSEPHNEANGFRHDEASTWKRWLNHPLPVQVIGGLIATVLGGAIILWLFH